MDFYQQAAFSNHSDLFALMREIHTDNGVTRQKRGSTRGVKTDARGVSPVIGVVLMLAITVSLVLVVTPVIFTVSSSAGESPPDTDFAYFYDEAVDGAEQDSFGDDASGVNGDGLLTITFESGTAIPVEELSLEGSEGSGTLVSAGTYEDGDELLPGDEITVWVSRGADIHIIWEESGSSSSAILDSFTVPQPSS